MKQDADALAKLKREVTIWKLQRKLKMPIQEVLESIEGAFVDYVPLLSDYIGKPIPQALGDKLRDFIALSYLREITGTNWEVLDQSIEKEAELLLSICDSDDKALQRYQMNSIIIRPVGDDFLIENFENLEAIQVKFTVSGVEALALASVLAKLDEKKLDPVCKKIAQSLLKRLDKKLAEEQSCALST